MSRRSRVGLWTRSRLRVVEDGSDAGQGQGPGAGGVRSPWKLHREEGVADVTPGGDLLERLEHGLERVQREVRVPRVPPAPTAPLSVLTQSSVAVPSGPSGVVGSEGSSPEDLGGGVGRNACGRKPARRRRKRTVEGFASELGFR